MARNDPIFDPDASPDAPPDAPPDASPDASPDAPTVVPNLAPSLPPNPAPSPAPNPGQSYRVVRVANGPQRSVGVAYLLFCFSFLGIAGIQHFYLGHFFRGVLWLFTWGLFGIGLIYDLFATGSQVYEFNARRSDVVAQPYG